jgi:hypothetical protein
MTYGSQLARYKQRVFFSFLRAFAKLRKATISFVMSVRPSAWNNSTLTGRIFMKFDIEHFSKLRQECSSFIKP